MVLSNCYVLSVKWVLERMRIIMMIDRLHDVLSYPIGKEVGEYYSLSETKSHFLTGIKSKNDGSNRHFSFCRVYEDVTCKDCDSFNLTLRDCLFKRVKWLPEQLKNLCLRAHWCYSHFIRRDYSELSQSDFNDKNAPLLIFPVSFFQINWQLLTRQFTYSNLFLDPIYVQWPV